MSFGFSVGDFLAVGRLCWSVYKRCKESPGNYAELARYERRLVSLHSVPCSKNQMLYIMLTTEIESEIGNLHNVIKETEELLAQQSLTSIQQQRLAACHRGCRAVLTDFDALLAKYESLGTQSRRTFDRMGFGMHDMSTSPPLYASRLCTTIRWFLCLPCYSGWQPISLFHPSITTAPEHLSLRVVYFMGDL